MTNPTRTRAEIQADIEKLQAEMESAWPKVGDNVYLEAIVNQIDDDVDGIVDVRILGDGDVYQVNTQALIPASDLIPREEHERAVERVDADAAMVGALSHKLDANTAVKYLVNEYDLDTGHMDTVEPRWYSFDHNGHIYEVVVRRKDDHFVDVNKMIQGNDTDAAAGRMLDSRTWDKAPGEEGTP